ncbi:hypothetical protein ACFOY2_26565 [Nonomuraea purpurea]|uniref:Uncharacterized protein n=1 Tax=Nonomuraea purpurea TaxID=1849276 RepID=A0ABV8GCJ9_9ACTN
MGDLIGFTRCSTALQHLTAQQQILADLGVANDRIYLAELMEVFSAGRATVYRVLDRAVSRTTVEMDSQPRPAR